MADWVRATVDNSQNVIWLNLALAVKIERLPNLNYTSIQFVSGSGSIPTLSETPEELLRQLD
jgi:hypothetical protein